MDWLSSIFDWLSDHEAGISAVVGIAVLAGIVFTGVRLLLGRRSQPGKESAADEDRLLAIPTGPVVAVLPFENLSRDPDQEYFSDGLTEDIITALSRFKDLFVIARNSTFRYKGQPVDVRQLNKELGARYVLEGSVQRAESRLRVTAQLLDAKEGTHLWAETYDRDLSASSIFDVQDEITGQVVATIAGVHGVISRVRFAEVDQHPTDQLDAYESVLQTMAYFRETFDATEHARVRDSLERAVKSAPRYADAWASLSMVYNQEHTWHFNARPKPLDRSLEAARRAVAADPANPFPHRALALAHFMRHQLDEFFADAERALALNPNDIGNLATLGTLFHWVGDERGITLVRKAMALDPFHAKRFNAPIARHHFERGEYEQALVAARKIDTPGLFTAQIFLAGICAELGRRTEAQSAVEELLRLRPGFSIEELIEEMEKWNYGNDRTRRLVAALRKAGLPD